MKQTTNYILLFSLLVYLKFNNNDTVKIGVSLLITYIVYQLFKKNNIENFPEPSCSPMPQDNTIADGCIGIVGYNPRMPDSSCVSTSDAKCDCDTRKGWKRIGSSSYSNNFSGRPSPPLSKVGKCFCDPYNSETGIASPCYNDSSPKNYTSCRAWSKLPGCPPGTILKSGSENNPMGEDPDNTCCSSPRPGPTPSTSCSPSPCPENSYCDSSTAPNCVCSPGYTPNASGTCTSQPSQPPQPNCPSCAPNSYCDSNTAPQCVCSPGYSKDPDDPSSTCEFGYIDYMKDLEWYWWVLVAIGVLVLVLIIVFIISWLFCCWPYTIFSVHGRFCPDEIHRRAQTGRHAPSSIQVARPGDSDWLTFGDGGRSLGSVSFGRRPSG